jgi:hypothetical protein
MQADRQAVQAVLRTWFARWGLPGALRLDNGQPWGSGHDLPPALALWLLGLGIALVWNRPRHKQGNAVIENGHGVCQRWVEAHTCPDPATLQARLDWATTTQRERYPSCHGRSRLAAYPALAASERPYDPAQEAQCWDEHRVWQWLGGHVWTRRVDKVGHLSLANRALAVGRPWAHQEVTVQLVGHDDAPHWQIRDGQGHILRQHPAPELRSERIRALDVSRRRVRPTRGKPRVHHQA